MVSNVIPAVLHTSQSSDLAICVPTEFDINLYPRFRNASPVQGLAEPDQKKLFGRERQPVWNAPSRLLSNDNTPSVIGLSLSACTACRTLRAKERKLHRMAKKQG